MRDHLFISYAWEDQAFARWLALRLTTERYRVWIDKNMLLGGESWPNDIDTAIKTRTFRMLALLSRSSVTKPNPVKERTLALTLAKRPELKGFLVPINVDGLAAAELDWLTSDLVFIPFADSWAQGLAQVLKLLEREGCPRFEGDGRAIARRTLDSSGLLRDVPETLTSNVQIFSRVPAILNTYRVSRKLEGTRRVELLRDWPFVAVTPFRAVAFHPPDEKLAEWVRPELANSADWLKQDVIEGINSAHLVSTLLRCAVETRCQLRGLQWRQDIGAYYFATRLGGTLPVRLPSGRTTHCVHSGQRTYFRIGQSKQIYRYRLAVRASVERNMLGMFTMAWRLRFFLTDDKDQPLLPALQLSRRKHVTRSWFNYQWLVRHLGVIQHLQDPEGGMRLGPTGLGQVVVEDGPLMFTALRGIDESKLDVLEELSDDVPVEYDDPSEPEEKQDGPE